MYIITVKIPGYTHVFKTDSEAAREWFIAQFNHYEWVDISWEPRYVLVQDEQEQRS